MQNLKLSAGNMEKKNLGDLGFGNDILDTTPKVQSIRE